VGTGCPLLALNDRNTLLTNTLGSVVSHLLRELHLGVGTFVAEDVTTEPTVMLPLEQGKPSIAALALVDLIVRNPMFPPCLWSEEGNNSQRAIDKKMRTQREERERPYQRLPFGKEEREEQGKRTKEKKKIK
jgi:hypothetical protein